MQSAMLTAKYVILFQVSIFLGTLKHFDRWLYICTYNNGDYQPCFKHTVHPRNYVYRARLTVFSNMFEILTKSFRTTLSTPDSITFSEVPVE